MHRYTTGEERAHGFTRPSLAQHKHFLLQLRAILADVRLARSLFPLVRHYTNERTVKKMIEPSKRQHDDVVSRYGDVFSKIGDAPMLVFPQPPTQQLDCHIEISDGSHSLESELSHSNYLHYLMAEFTRSLHVHDASTIVSMPA